MFYFCSIVVIVRIFFTALRIPEFSVWCVCVWWGGGVNRLHFELISKLYNRSLSVVSQCMYDHILRIRGGRKMLIFLLLLFHRCYLCCIPLSMLL